MDYLLNLEKLTLVSNHLNHYTRNINAKRFFSEYRFNNLNALVLSYLNSQEIFMLSKLNKQFYDSFRKTDEFAFCKRLQKNLYSIYLRNKGGFITKILDNNAKIIENILPNQKHNLNVFRNYIEVAVVPLVKHLLFNKQNSKESQFIYLSFVNLGKFGSIILNSILENCKDCIEELLIDSCTLDFDYFSFESLKNQKRLIRLILPVNSIRESTMKGISDSFVSLSSTLKDLNFVRCNIDNKTLLKLTPKIKYLQNLETLHLSDNSFDAGGLKTLLKCLNFCKKIKILNLSNNPQFNDQTHSIICEFIELSTSLKMIFLNKTSINSKSIQYYSRILKESTLEKLLLNDNKLINSEGFNSLAKGIIGCTNLRHISLSNNNVTFDDFKAIYDACIRSSVNVLSVAHVDQEVKKRIDNYRSQGKIQIN